MNDKNYSLIEKAIGIIFKDKSLLKQAFIHRSFLNESGKKLSSNETLEFLGDSVLSFVTSSYLFSRFPDFNEGLLTNYRSALVCTKSLSSVAKQINLGIFLKMSKGEFDSGGINNPSLLANTVEALIGAIYLDQGLGMAEKFIKRFILSNLSAIITEIKLKDYKSLFQENVQLTIKYSPVYKVLDSWGPDHERTFKIGVFVENIQKGEGTGKNKQEAEQNAAKAALENWEKIK